MKLKKSLVSSIVIAILFGGLSASTTAGENNAGAQDINALRTKIGELEKTINTQAEQIRRMEKELGALRKQLDAQIKENERLRELYQKEDVGTATKEAGSDSKPIGHIIYRGKERDEEWFDRMYEQFSDKIVLVKGKILYKKVLENGKVTDISESFEPPHISQNYVKVGTIVRGGTGKVISVIGEGEALIFQGGITGYVGQLGSPIETPIIEPEIVFHIRDYKHPLIDGQRVYLEYLICVGTYEYTTAKGAQKTVQSFKLWQPETLTREQFAEALRGGFELVNYVERQGKTVKIPIR
jgi:regulator of replication initiation timing